MKNLFIIFVFIILSSCSERNERLEYCEGNLLDEFVSSGEDIYNHYLSEDYLFAGAGKIVLEDVLKLESVEDIISFYESGSNQYSPSYVSQYPDWHEVDRVVAEFVLSRDSIQKLLTPSLRNKLLSVAIDVQKYKYDDERYIAPFITRKTGFALVLKTLQYADAQSALEEICIYCDKNKFKEISEPVNNKKFNDFLIQCLSDYLYYL